MSLPTTFDLNLTSRFSAKAPKLLNESGAKKRRGSGEVLCELPH